MPYYLVPVAALEGVTAEYEAKGETLAEAFPNWTGTHVHVWTDPPDPGRGYTADLETRGPA